MTPEKRLADDDAGEQEPKRLKEDSDDVSEGASNKTETEEKPEAVSSDAPTEEVENSKDEKFVVSEECGTLLLSGCVQWNLIGRRNLKATPALQHFTPRRAKTFANIKVSFVASHCSAAHHIIITQDGTVYTMGRNEKGQLGCGDCEEHAGPVKVNALDGLHVIAGAVGRNHSLFLTDDGTVYACGDNKSGQCGVGNNTAVITTPTKIDFKEGRISKVACGAEFSMIIDKRGYLYSFGCPEYGQLGHNTDGKYFITSNKLSFEFVTSPRRIPVFVECAKGGPIKPIPDVHVTDVACGNNHTVVRDSQKRAFAWGFGGYGRLGHAEPKDEMIPRLIKFFDGHNRGVLQVFCGSTFTVANTELGVYLWGQTKRTGEANMYPKPIQDLYGWNVRSIGCSATSIVVAADDNVIAWGPSPTYGELGLGDNIKSSTTPKECKHLDGVHVYQVACSAGLTLYIARDSTDQDKGLLAKLKEVPV
ncbi:hypothetical protein HAZT_HAZT005946 [Hyalella azteca]|uniref:Protein RCC2 homolog n=1 Tax=Hyalella azteca TaxID=294128 RepID=A0A6A0GZK8_HYAAZ|nr:protein RCC2 homolog [Hyalella azteca]KAA0194131.1 hypothetical protein HAZT_HAZT005946 [Hyalella azteca]